MKSIFKLKKEKGVAGLTMFLSVVTLLFIIGLLVMIYAIIGMEVYETDASLKTGVAGSLSGVQFQLNDTGVQPTGIAALRDVAYVSGEVNITVNVTWLDSNNYSLSAGIITGTGADFNLSLANVTANYTSTADTTQSVIINDTTKSLADSTDFFSIIIVISAMVVLILLTVIIINGIRTSGLIQSA